MSLSDLVALDPAIGSILDSAGTTRRSRNRERNYTWWRSALEPYVGHGRRTGPAELQTAEAWEVAVQELARRLGC